MYASPGWLPAVRFIPCEAYTADKAECLAHSLGWWTFGVAGMRQFSRQFARDAFPGMAPCGPLYSLGKRLWRTASNSGFSKSVFRVIGHCRSDKHCSSSPRQASRPATRVGLAADFKLPIYRAPISRWASGCEQRTRRPFLQYDQPARSA